MTIRKQEEAMNGSEFKRILDASKINSLTFFVGAGVSALADAQKRLELIDSFYKVLKKSTKNIVVIEEYIKNMNKGVISWKKILMECYPIMI